MADAEREGETREFKEHWTAAALEDIAAFANTRGGTLSVGMRDDGTIVGFEAGDTEVQRITSQLVDVLGLRPAIEWRTAGGKRVLDIHISAAAGLVSCKGRYLGRVGSTNRELSPEQMARRVMERTGQTWDAWPLSQGHASELIDPGAVSAFIRLARPRLPQMSAEESPERVLENLSLSEHSRLRRAAIVLFGKPERLFPSAQVHLGRFRAGMILHDRTIAGSLIEQLDRIMDWIRSVIEIRLSVEVEGEGVEALQRREQWEYPPEALREGAVNALIHRDYAALGEIQIRVYDDRFDIWSPGGLPEGVSLDDLRREGHVSKLRNPLLAQVFYYAGLVERWGTGTTRIIAACRAHRLPDPEFTEESGGFRLVIRKDHYTRERLLALGLNERQVQAMLYVKEKGSITNAEYQALATTSERTATVELGNLVAQGFLERQGRTGRGTRYTARKPQNAQ